MRGFGTTAMAGIALLALAGCADDTGAGMEPGMQMLASKNYASAVAFFTDSVAEDPDNGYAHLNLAAAHQGRGDLGLAREHYQRALELGEDLRIRASLDGTEARDSTVAAVAAYNLSNLPQ